MSAPIAFAAGFFSGVFVLCAAAWIMCERDERKKRRANPPVPDSMPEHLHVGPIEDQPVNRISRELDPWWED